MNQAIDIFWFRRDLRLRDNTALYQALKSNRQVLPIFIFDPQILDKLQNKSDRRVAFIHEALSDMQQELEQIGASLHVFHGSPMEIFSQLVATYKIEKVFANHDYEPYATQRDESVASLVREHGAELLTFKDQVIFEKSEIVKDDGKPYTVFTPYSRKWKATLKESDIASFPSEKHLSNIIKQSPVPIPSLEKLGFKASAEPFPKKKVEEELIVHYGEKRDFPSINGTSKLGVHFRFGTVSIRKAAARAMQLSPVFLSELIWRDFYHMILWNFPQVGQHKAFKPAYDNIEWRNDDGQFEKWCEGNTGYPIVDAGMRELNTTGFMHNRVRMIVASFLCKHLLLDWRLGEAYFAEKLLDFDLAANNGGWQWAAGSGCDAAPYFRIFNPYLQTKRFDPEFAYIKKWVPEFQEARYAKPIVVHEDARKRCLEVYGKALSKT